MIFTVVFGQGASCAGPEALMLEVEVPLFSHSDSWKRTSKQLDTAVLEIKVGVKLRERGWE